MYFYLEKNTDKNTCIRITGLHQTEVCSAPRPYLTLFELVSEVIEAVSLFFGFFKLDLSGPLLVLLPAKKSLVLTVGPEFNSKCLHETIKSNLCIELHIECTFDGP